MVVGLGSIWKKQEAKRDTSYHNYIEEQTNISGYYAKIWLNGKEAKKWDICDKTFTGGSWDDRYEYTVRCPNYYYKVVDSVIYHNNPTPDLIKSQAENYLVSKNLPIDDPRYVDFITKDWRYALVLYPNFFEIGIDEENRDLDYLKNKLSNYIEERKQVLQNIETWVNNWDINTEMYKTNSAKYKNLKLANLNRETNWTIRNALLKNTTAPSSIWPSSAKKDVDIFWEKKQISEMDLVAFSILWNNFSTEEKYSYVFEKYLPDNEKDKDDLFLLPKQRKQYEIAYLEADWNAANLMISLDAEAKNNLNPDYSNIIDLNNALNSTILWYDIANWSTSISNLLTWNSGNSSDSWNSQNNNTNSTFDCAPPDWVPIWQWPSAVSCRLQKNLPPTITISEWSCSNTNFTFEFNEDDFKNNDIYNTLTWDSNSNNSNNSWQNWQNWQTSQQCSNLSDCLESIDAFKISADSQKYSYNSSGKISATFYSKGQKATYINSTLWQFKILKIEKAKDVDKPISDSNLEIVYDSSNPNLSDSAIPPKYISIHTGNIISTLWEISTWFTVKNKDANIYIEAETLPTASATKTFKTWILKLEVRDWNLWIFTSKYDKTNKSFENLSSVEANDKANIYVLDLGNKNISDFESVLNSKVTSEKNLIIWLNKYSKKIPIDLNYPLNIF